VKIRVPAGRKEETSTRTGIPNPKIWSIKDPNRYVAVTTVEQDGKVVDSYETPFGVRTIRFDPERGFVLNGESVKFQGVCDHHDLGALGAAINYRGLQRQLEILREMGCNAIRTSHNPPAPELLDLCDKMGFVVMDESFDCWAQQKRPNDYHLLFNDWSEKDMRMLVRRDRNHPSVVMWSIGNEIPEQGRGEAGAAMATRLANIVHDEDPTRPTTSALNSAQPGSPFAAALDVIGVNYQGSRYSAQRPLGNYEPFHQAYPDKFVYGSETASTISTRGVYTFPVATGRGAISQGPRGGGRGTTEPTTTVVAPPGQDIVAHQMSSYDLYYPSWATSPETEFGAQDRFPFVGGEFVWTGFDYLGEPTPWGQRNDVSRSSYFGIIDLAGFKKDRFYLYQSHWRPDLPMAHILPHWNWPERAGQVTPVHVYTTGDEGELFLNGKSMGKQKKEQYSYRLRWDDVAWTPGELKVVTYKDGKHWAEDVVKTTGPANKLRLEPDHNRIMADGHDLSFVTVTVADKQGLPVPRSMNKLKFEISGPGEIFATDNGDPTNLESIQTTEKAAFNGLCLVIVRAKAGQNGKITLKAMSEGLRSEDVVISAVSQH
jgi:beta-galactosidase